MNWLGVHIDTTHDGLEAVEVFLSTLGIDDVAIEDGAETQAFLDAQRAAGTEAEQVLRQADVGRARVTFYLEAGDDGFARLAAVRLALSSFRREHPDCGTLLMTLDDLESEDWENGWRQYYKPMEIGRRLVIVPRWESVPDTHGRIPLILDPGTAFGTGSHTTTRLCLRALEERIHGGERVLDLGCGSGILSIAALKLGAESAFACDIDGSCVDIACENAAQNGIDRARYTVRAGDILTDEALRREIGGGYDLVAANIVSDVILSLAPAVRSLLSPGGLFLCSGVIDTRAAEVADGLRLAGLSVLESTEESGWFSFLCR